MSYRSVHMEKGSTYDDSLQADPLDAFMANREAQMLPGIVKSLFNLPIPKYLDFACGTGRILGQLESLATEATGVDISASMLESAQQRCKTAKLVCKDITVDGHGFSDIDLVTSFRFFGNADDDMREIVMKSLAEMLRPGGYLVMNNHRNPGSIISRLGRLRGQQSSMTLTHSRLDSLFDTAGLKPVSRHGVGLFFLRGAFARADLLEGPTFQRLDKLSALPGVARLCPDAIVVAQKPA